MDAALGPPEKMAERADELTPMMAQYHELCGAYDDSLVLFQVGDFYEAFCEAAERVARLCEITLTQREDSTGEYAMAATSRRCWTPATGSPSPTRSRTPTRSRASSTARSRGSSRPGR